MNIEGSTWPGHGPLVSRAEKDPRVLAILEDPKIKNTEAARLLGVDESSVRRWRSRRNSPNLNAYRPDLREGEDRSVIRGAFTDEHRQRMHTRLDQVLDEIDEGSTVKGLRVSQWENVMKGSEGEPIVTQLQGIKLDIKVNEIAPDWPLIDRPYTLLKVPAGEPRPAHPKDKVAVILPDPQIGYRMFEGGELDPFHDENAIDVAMQVTRDLSPGRVVCLGDFEDFAEFGKYAQEAAFARTTQKGIDRGHEFCAQLREAAPDAEDISIMEGNHDRRAQKRITEANAAAWGLKRAADTTGWPVFSVPYLCAFDMFGIKYVGGYPAGEVWITDELRCIHGLKVRSSGSTAAAVVRDDGVSTIFGHVHRLELQHMTRRVRGSGHNLLAATPGCLCRIDGTVPSAKGSTTLDGRPVEGAENWQQGMAVVEYKKGRSSFALSLLHINTYNNYEARFNGKSYTPSRKSNRVRTKEMGRTLP